MVVFLRCPPQKSSPKSSRPCIQRGFRLPSIGGLLTDSPISLTEFVAEQSTLVKSCLARARMSSFFVTILWDVSDRLMTEKSEYFTFKVSVLPSNRALVMRLSNSSTRW